MRSNESKLQREIKQSKPFPNRASEAALGLLRTADHIRRRTDAVLAPTALSAEQYNVLRILRGSGGEGVATLDIADRMIERSPGITRLLDKLEAKKLVKRKRCGEDRRRVLCYITAAGIDLLASLDTDVEQATRSALAVLNRQELETLIALMDRIRDTSDAK